LILVGTMWRGLADWARTAMLRPGQSLADAEDLAIPQCVGTVEETLAVIREDREDWLRQQPARAEVS
jgi:hypothetical protein